MKNINLQLETLSKELSKHKNIETLLGKSFERPIKSISDGYPEFAISWMKSAFTTLLQTWFKKKNINISEKDENSIDNLVKIFVESSDNNEINAYFNKIAVSITKLEKEWNKITSEKAIEIFNDLLHIFSWLDFHKEKEISISLKKGIVEKLAFIIKYMRILKYKVITMYEVTSDAAYILFENKTGIKYDYIEVIISDSFSVLEKILNQKQKLFDTNYPLNTSFIITDNSKIKNSKFKNNEIFTINSFINKYLNFDEYARLISSKTDEISKSKFVPLKGQLLSYKSHKQDFEIDTVNDISNLLRDYIENKESSNLFVISKPGGGKTSICKSVFKYLINSDNINYAIYFDLSLMDLNETIEDFLTRQTSKLFNLKTNEIFDVISFLNNQGKLIILLDGFDEIFGKVDIDDLMIVFSEISKLFTNKSKIIITSRLSFFLSSKYMSELLDKNAVVSDKVSFGLTSAGIDPLQLPNFKILKLSEINLTDSECSLRHKKIFRNVHNPEKINLSPLQYQLLGSLKYDSAIKSIKNDVLTTSILLKAHFDEIVKKTELNQDTVEVLLKYFFISFQNKQTKFNIIELFSYFGYDLFPDNIPAYENMNFRELFIKISDNEIKFAHKNFFEFIFAYGYVKGFMLKSDEILITDEIRKYVNEISATPELFNLKIDNKDTEFVLQKGHYIVGDFDKVLIKKVEKSIVFDEFSVTVEKYNEFLEYAKNNDITSFEHPNQPENHSHIPYYEKLKIKDYYTNKKYLNYPAICLTWWNAYTYAKFVGKRLPSSFEWECAARGKYGRLFSWGNKVDKQIANSADYWAKELLITYDKWRIHYDKSGDMRGGMVLAVDDFKNNISPFNIKNMCGNIWEYSTSVTDDFSKVIICGGSYDNPFRAIKASSKGVANIVTQSNAVGFRCCEDE